jgi:hypothetical protein
MQTFRLKTLPRNSVMGEFRCYGSARGERVDFSGVYLAEFRVFFHGFFGKEC